MDFFSQNTGYLYIGIGVFVLFILILFFVGYTKAPPDVAKIISGLMKVPRVLAGRAGLRIPFLERVDEIYLGQISVDIKTDTYIPTQDFINVKVDAIAKVRVKSDADGIQLAAKNFLNKTSEMIAEELQDSLQGNMREIIGTLDLKTINTDRDKFSDQVMEKAARDMERLGIEILSCNIQNVVDEHGLINDMGMDNTSMIKKNAAIAKATAEKEIAIAQAEADKAANEARVSADAEIAEKQNELAIKKANLKKESDTAKAVADAAYEIQKQEQEKTIQTATVNAQIAKAEREADLKSKEVTIREQELQATMNKVADAEKYKAEKNAEADLIKRQRNAEAEKYEQEQRAAAQMKLADAQKYSAEQESAAVKAKAEAEAAGIAAKLRAEAEGIAAKGKAEAEAIRAKGEAEALAMDKKAEAYKKYNGAAMAEMMIKIMPQMAAEIAKPLGQIEKINIYGTTGDGGNGVSQVSSSMPVIMKQVFDTMSEATGVDFSEIMKANTYDAKVTKNINLSSPNGAEVQIKAPPAENGGEKSAE